MEELSDSFNLDRTSNIEHQTPNIKLPPRHVAKAISRHSIWVVDSFFLWQYGALNRESGNFFNLVAKDRRKARLLFSVHPPGVEPHPLGCSASPQKVWRQAHYGGKYMRNAMFAVDIHDLARRNTSGDGSAHLVAYDKCCVDQCHTVCTRVPTTHTVNLLSRITLGA